MSLFIDRHEWKIVLVLGVALVFLAGSAAIAGGREEFQWSGSVTGHVELKNINGDVQAMPGSGSVEVTAVKTGDDSDPSTVKIEVVEHAEGVTICAVYPGSDPCTPGRGKWRGGAEDNDVQVEFTVRVPAGLDFLGTTVNGEMNVDGLAGNVYATTVNGSVDVTADGWVVARTVNGDVDVEMGAFTWDDDVSFKTVNGSITLRMPSAVGADVRIKTLNGKIRTDFPLEIDTGKYVGNKARGSIGGGGPRVEIETVNGSVKLLEM